MTPTPSETALSGEPPEWVDLAADIRRVDGNHDLGAGALAAALTARGWTRAARSQPATQGLDDAWTAVEAVLPKGWACMVSGEGEEPEAKYIARAGSIVLTWPVQVVWATGAAPAAALRALRAALAASEPDE